MSTDQPRWQLNMKTAVTNPHSTCMKKFALYRINRKGRKAVCWKLDGRHLHDLQLIVLIGNTRLGSIQDHRNIPWIPICSHYRSCFFIPILSVIARILYPRVCMSPSCSHCNRYSRMEIANHPFKEYNPAFWIVCFGFYFFRKRQNRGTPLLYVAFAGAMQAIVPLSFLNSKSKDCRFISSAVMFIR